MAFNYSIFKSGVFWSAAVLVLYNFFTALVPVFPNVMWLGAIVDILGFVSLNYFHKAAVLASAQATLAAGRLASGQ